LALQTRALYHNSEIQYCNLIIYQDLHIDKTTINRKILTPPEN